MKLFLILISLLLPIVSFASNSDLKITEIMYNPDGADAGNEWIEICNVSAENIILKTGKSGWRFSDKYGNHILNLPIISNETIIQNKCLILINSDNTNNFLNKYPNFSGIFIKSAINLINSSDTLKISDENGNILDEATYFSDWGGNGNNSSLEKINPFGSNTANNWKESSAPGGTPGYFTDPPITAPKTETPQPAQISQTPPPAPTVSIPSTPIISEPQTTSTPQTFYPPQTQPAPKTTAEIQNNQTILNQTHEKNTTDQITAKPSINSNSAELPITSPPTPSQNIPQTFQNSNQPSNNQQETNTNIQMPQNNNSESSQPSVNTNPDKNLTAAITNSLQNNLKNAETNYSTNTKTDKSDFPIYFLAIGIAAFCVSGIIYISKIIN